MDLVAQLGSEAVPDYVTSYLNYGALLSMLLPASPSSPPPALGAALPALRLLSDVSVSGVEAAARAAFAAGRDGEGEGGAAAACPRSPSSPPPPALTALCCEVERVRSVAGSAGEALWARLVDLGSAARSEAALARAGRPRGPRVAALFAEGEALGRAAVDLDAFCFQCAAATAQVALAGDGKPLVALASLLDGDRDAASGGPAAYLAAAQGAVRAAAPLEPALLGLSDAFEHLRFAAEVAGGEAAIGVGGGEAAAGPGAAVMAAAVRAARDARGGDWSEFRAAAAGGAAGPEGQAKEGGGDGDGNASASPNAGVDVVVPPRLPPPPGAPSCPFPGSPPVWVAPDSFSRVTRKFWLRARDAFAFKVALSRHLPVLIYGGAEAPTLARADGLPPTLADVAARRDGDVITSVYLDEPAELPLYRGRLARDDGAVAVRLRWYGGTAGADGERAELGAAAGELGAAAGELGGAAGGLGGAAAGAFDASSSSQRASLPLAQTSGASLRSQSPIPVPAPGSAAEVPAGSSPRAAAALAPPRSRPQLFVERKTHHDNPEPSLKDRAAVSLDGVRALLRGEAPPVAPAGSPAAALLSDVAARVRGQGLRPLVRTRYRRTAFQAQANNDVRVSMDCELVGSYERLPVERDGPGGGWRFATDRWDPLAPRGRRGGEDGAGGVACDGSAPASLPADGEDAPRGASSSSVGSAASTTSPPRPAPGALPGASPGALPGASPSGSSPGPTPASGSRSCASLEPIPADADARGFASLPYVVVEVKLTVPPPAWLTSLVGSARLLAVRRYSKLIHATACLLPLRVQDALPVWMVAEEADAAGDPGRPDAPRLPLHVRLAPWADLEDASREALQDPLRAIYPAAARQRDDALAQLDPAAEEAWWAEVESLPKPERKALRAERKRARGAAYRETLPTAYLPAPNGPGYVRPDGARAAGAAAPLGLGLGAPGAGTGAAAPFGLGLGAPGAGTGAAAPFGLGLGASSQGCVESLRGSNTPQSLGSGADGDARDGAAAAAAAGSGRAAQAQGASLQQLQQQHIQQQQQQQYYLQQQQIQQQRFVPPSLALNSNHGSYASFASPASIGGLYGLPSPPAGNGFASLAPWQQQQQQQPLAVPPFSHPASSPADGAAPGRNPLALPPSWVPTASAPYLVSPGGGAGAADALNSKPLLASAREAGLRGSTAPGAAGGAGGGGAGGASSSRDTQGDSAGGKWTQASSSDDSGAFAKAAKGDLEAGAGAGGAGADADEDARRRRGGLARSLWSHVPFAGSRHARADAAAEALAARAPRAVTVASAHVPAPGAAPLPGAPFASGGYGVSGLSGSPLLQPGSRPCSPGELPLGDAAPAGSRLARARARLARAAGTSLHYARVLICPADEAMRMDGSLESMVRAVEGGKGGVKGGYGGGCGAPGHFGSLGGGFGSPPPTDRPKDRKLRAPNGAIVRQRIEPKTFFANERTFLQWLQISVLVMFTALSLLGNSTVSVSGSSTVSAESSGHNAPRISGAVIAPVAVVFMVYALVRYKVRTYQILRQKTVRYDDQWGPVLLVVLLIACVLISYVITMVYS